MAERRCKDNHIAHFEIERVLGRLANDGFHTGSAVIPDDLVRCHPTIKESNVLVNALDVLEVPSGDPRAIFTHV